MSLVLHKVDLPALPEWAVAEPLPGGGVLDVAWFYDVERARRYIDDAEHGRRGSLHLTPGATAKSNREWATILMTYETTEYAQAEAVVALIRAETLAMIKPAPEPAPPQ